MKVVNLDEALRGIYIDFEGGGPVRRAFLGAFWLDDTNDFIFRQYLLDEALWPMGGERGSGNEGFWEPADLTNTLEELRQLAEAEDRLVFAYSEHEQKMIKEHLQEGELLDWWLQDQNLVNARKIAKYWKYWNRAVTFPPKEGQKKEWHSLQNYLDLIGYEVPSEHGPGVVSSAITQVRKELVEGDGPLSEEANLAWEQAVMHNFHDCCGMRELIIICATEQSFDSKGAQEVGKAVDAIGEAKPASSTDQSPTAGFNQHTAESRARFDKSRPGLLAEHSRAYLRWTAEEDDYLLRQHCQGDSVEEIAKLLDRNHGAILSRLEKLGLQDR